jgi:hypothetical protein
VRYWGPEIAKALALRLQQLRAADCLADLRQAPGRFHELKGTRAGQIAADLPHSKRLILFPEGSVLHKPDGGLDWQQVTAVLILEVVDYHD